MSGLRATVRLLLGAIGAAFALSVVAADFPAPKQGSWIAKDFKFHTGEVLPELKLAYTTVGDPKGEPVLMLHGTTGSAASMLTPAFGGELYGAGQPLVVHLLEDAHLTEDDLRDITRMMAKGKKR